MLASHNGRMVPMQVRDGKRELWCGKHRTWFGLFCPKCFIEKGGVMPWSEPLIITDEDDSGYEDAFADAIELDDAAADLLRREDAELAREREDRTIYTEEQ